MEINFEQAQMIVEFVDKKSREYCVASYILYDYLVVKAKTNNRTIIEQIDKINDSLEAKSHKNSDKRKAIQNKVLLRDRLHKYWKKLVENEKDNQAIENYKKFRKHYKYLKKENEKCLERQS